MFSRTGHVITETVYGQTLTLWLGDGDEHRLLESDMTGLNVKGNLYLNEMLHTAHAKNNHTNDACFTGKQIKAVCYLLVSVSV